MNKSCVSDLEQFAGISITALCSTWEQMTPFETSQTLTGYMRLGSTHIPDGAWDDLSLLANVCNKKILPERSA